MKTFTRDMWKLLLLLTLLGSSRAGAQTPEAVTRFDYYFATDSTATVLLFGEGLADVESLVIEGRPAQRIEARTDLQLFAMPVEPYGAGAHHLDCEIQLKSGRRAQAVLELRKLPVKPNAVRVDRLTGGLMVDDLPFFPFGYYASFPVGDLPAQEVYNAMNLIGVYQANDDETLDARRAYMDLCASLGIKVNYAVNGLVGTPHNRTDIDITPEEEERRWQSLRREIRAFRDHPALLSWYMNDEPVGQSRDPALLERAYRLIKEEDPYHPVSVVFVIPDRAAPFRNTMDVAMTDPYPVPGDVAEVRGHMQALKENFGYRKALWLVPQAFGGGEFWRREPTAAEIQVMTWIGIQEGAMGIQYFIRRQPNLFPKSRVAWNAAVEAAHEVSMLSPWLASGEPRLSLDTGSERSRATVFTADGSSLVVVTNADNSPVSLSVDASGLAGSETGVARVPFEDRQVELRGGRLEEPLGPLGARVYLLESNAAADDSFPSQNLFPNPGFEWVASPGVPAGSYADSDNRPRYDGSTYFVDSRLSHGGHNSLRFRTVSDTSHLALTFQRMYTEPGRTYRTSLWTRSSRFGPASSVTVSVPPLDVASTVSTHGSWTEHALRFRAPEDSPFVQLLFEPSGAGTIWIDDVVVVPDPRVDVKVEEGPAATVRLTSEDPGVRLAYSVNGSPEQDYDGPLHLEDFAKIRVFVESPGSNREQFDLTVPLSKATLKACTFLTPYSPKYTGSGEGTLVDGRYGSLAFRDNRYLGFDGKDVELVVDLGAVTQVNSVTAHFLVSVDDGIHAPLRLEAWTSTDGETWTALGTEDDPGPSRHGNAYHSDVDILGPTRAARFVRLKAGSPIKIPYGYLFAGTDAWIFMDEVMVHGPVD